MCTYIPIRNVYKSLKNPPCLSNAMVITLEKNSPCLSNVLLITLGKELLFFMFNAYFCLILTELSLNFRCQEVFFVI